MNEETVRKLADMLQQLPIMDGPDGIMAVEYDDIVELLGEFVVGERPSMSLSAWVPMTERRPKNEELAAKRNPLNKANKPATPEATAGA